VLDELVKPTCFAHGKELQAKEEDGMWVFVINEGLKKGDRVTMMSSHGNSRYIILSKVYEH
jgi:hypothetical protein